MTRDEVRVLDDPVVLRLIADPLRLRLLEALRRAPRTVTELGEELGVARTRLYYHVRLLEQHGLVEVAETNLVAGIPEKRYRVTAYRFVVDRSLIAGAEDARRPLDVLLSVILDEVAGEIRRAVASGLIDLSDGGGKNIAPGRMVLGRNWYRLTDDEVGRVAAAFAEFQRVLGDRQVEFHGAEQGEDGTPRYLTDDEAADEPGQPRALYETLIGFYPIVPPRPAGGEDR